MFKFEHHIFFYAFLLIPIFIGLFIIYKLSIKKKLVKLGDYALIRQLIPDVSNFKRHLKFILFLLGFSSLILGLCNLQTGSKLQEVKREGADLMVCLDISNSMLAQDLSPNRLERAKLAIEKMLDKLQGDRIGIVIFAGEAYVQLPITTDYGAAKLFLESINTKIISTQGTNIAAAINTAIESFGTDDGKNKAIVLITDGENNEEGAITAAEEAEKRGIMVHTIGVGSTSGVPIPQVNNGIVSGYKKDKDGNTIVSKLNTTLLEDIANKTNGVFIQATNADVGLDLVLDKLAELDKKQFESKMYTDYESQFQWFIGLALLLFSIDCLISERVSEWWKKLNLFGNA